MTEFFLITIGLCLLPLVSVALSAVIAKALGCKLNECQSHPCKVLGIDIGPLLYSMHVMGWLMIVTLPLAAILSVAWFAIGLWQIIVG